MGKLRIIIGVTVLALALLFAPATKVQAVGGGCVIGDDKGDTWVSLYQENPNGSRGRQVWNSILFHKGEILTINDSDVGPNLRMRYDYKNAPNDPMHGNVGFTCRNGEKIVLQ